MRAEVPAVKQEEHRAFPTDVELAGKNGKNGCRDFRGTIPVHPEPALLKELRFALQLSCCPPLGCDVPSYEKGAEDRPLALGLNATCPCGQAAIGCLQVTRIL